MQNASLTAFYNENISSKIFQINSIHNPRNKGNIKHVTERSESPIKRKQISFSLYEQGWLFVLKPSTEPRKTKIKIKQPWRFQHTDIRWRRKDCSFRDNILHLSSFMNDAVIIGAFFSLNQILSGAILDGIRERVTFWRKLDAIDQNPLNLTRR